MSRLTFQYHLVGIAMIAAVLGGCGLDQGEYKTIELRSKLIYGQTFDTDFKAGKHDAAVSLSADLAAKSLLSKESTLDDYIKYGLKNNAGLRATFERWRSAMQAIPQARALPDARFTWTHFLEPVETRTGSQKEQLSLSQAFPWFGTLKLRGDAAAKRAENLWWQVQTKRLAVKREIEKAYYEYGYIAQAIRITRESLELLKQAERPVQRHIQSGGDQSDLLKLQVEIGKVDDQLESLRKRQLPLSARLTSLLNRRSRTLLPWPKQVEATIQKITQTQAAHWLTQRNPELKSLNEKISEAEKRFALAKKKGYPDLAVGVKYAPTGDAVQPTSDSGNDPLALTFSMTLPLDREKYTAMRRQARRVLQATLSELRQRHNELNDQLEQILFNLDDTMRQVGLYRDTLLPRARETWEVTMTSYQSGQASLLDLLDSERTLLSFENLYWRANSNYEKSLADLNAICGSEIK